MAGARGADRVSRFPLLLALLMLAGTLGTLLWLRAELLDGQDAAVAGTVRRFEATEVLGQPESPRLVFEEVENLARASETDSIRRLVVTKRLSDGQEVVVRPFHLQWTEPGWRTGAAWVRLPVGEEPSGYLYLVVDRVRFRAVNIAIGVVGVLLMYGLATLLQRQRDKEVQVDRLEEELAQRKAQMIRLERLALAGQLSANVFHDIKKPVLNIKHEVADALDGDGRPVDEVLRGIQAQTDLFLAMLRELGMESFVNDAAAEPEWCDLADAVDRSLRLVKYEQGDVAVEVRFAPGTDYLLQAHRHRLLQLFSNLFLNAFQAMSASGRLRVTGELRPAERQFWLQVEDSGPGIPPELAATIFSPFVTSKGDRGGSGLGLFICRSIVDDLGGDIRALPERSPLGGAHFVLRLPAQTAGEG